MSVSERMRSETIISDADAVFSRSLQCSTILQLTMACSVFNWRPRVAASVPMVMWHLGIAVAYAVLGYVFAKTIESAERAAAR